MVVAQLVAVVAASPVGDIVIGATDWGTRRSTPNGSAARRPPARRGEPLTAAAISNRRVDARPRHPPDG